MFIHCSSTSATLQCHKINALVERQCRQIQISMKHTGVGSKTKTLRVQRTRLDGAVMTGFLRAATLGLVCLLGLAGGVAPASAADYPNRPVRWLIGFTAGGPVDTVARIMSQWLSEHFGQQFVVENRAGSGGNIAAAAAINSPPDGYTLLFVAPNNAISTSLYKKLPYDFIRDTVPVASIMQLTNMMVVSNAMPVKTVQEFIDYCKANPGRVSYASSGNGTSVHMSAELFKALTKVEMTHVPYRGSSAAMPDLISDKVQVIFDNLPSALEQVRGGTLRALGVTSPQRWPGVPDIPAIAETVPGFESVGFYGISAPKGTPPEIVETLNKAVGEALKDPKLVARLAEVGGIPKPMTPAEFGKLVADETEKWRKVVEFAGVSVD
jgi:tripartite-type tricarboxylate transporter receptor subunit TctC